MPKHNVGFEGLIPYLPSNAYHQVVDYIIAYKIQFTISKDRNSVLGDYRPPFNGKGHRISVNGSLNKYAFLITFLHELAHLQNHLNNGRKVLPHGKEWQELYANLLEQFVQQQIFPNDIVVAIRKTQINPAASSCAEVHLTAALQQYDENPLNLKPINSLAIGSYFITKDGRLFKLGEKRRTRYFGVEVKTNKLYLFSGAYMVKLYDQ